MSTVEAMSDPPLGFSAGDDPERDKRGKDPNGDSDDAQSRRDPSGFGSGGFDVAAPGQLFPRRGQRFSGPATTMPPGSSGASGPVNYDLARHLAAKSIGFMAPIPPSPKSAISDPVHLAETWLDGAT